MSNVLIGIIGVILFIGLALAGALFLGPRFQDAASSSKASASIQAVSQISHAANMYQVSEGKEVALGSDGVSDLVLRGYLKSLPSNPTGSGIIILASSSSGIVARMDLGGNAARICSEINRQSAGQGVALKNTYSGNVGCFVDDVGNPTRYTVFAR